MTIARLICMWAMFGTTWILFLSVLIKTKWWRSSAGVNVAVLSGWFCFTMTLIVTATLGVLPEWLRITSGITIYGGGTLILLWRVITLWYWNRHWWAWSKDGEE